MNDLGRKTRFDISQDLEAGVKQLLKMKQFGLRLTA